MYSSGSEIIGGMDLIKSLSILFFIFLIVTAIHIILGWNEIVAWFKKKMRLKNDRNA